MPTMMSVNEAKANFSGMLAEVESSLVSFMIMRYGRPIARVVPIKRTRKIRPLAGYGTNIAIKGDLFSDDSSLWEPRSRLRTWPHQAKPPDVSFAFPFPLLHDGNLACYALVKRWYAKSGSHRAYCPSTDSTTDSITSRRSAVLTVEVEGSECLSR